MITRVFNPFTIRGIINRQTVLFSSDHEPIPTKLPKVQSIL